MRSVVLDTKFEVFRKVTRYHAKVEWMTSTLNSIKHNQCIGFGLGLEEGRQQLLRA